MSCPSVQAEIRFYAELNDYLPEADRYRTLERMLAGPGTVQDMIESCGIPLTEIELILANGESVDFSYVVCDGDRIAVYPMFESLDITPELRVRPEALRETRFVMGANLGRLTAYLRMLGFDALYRNSFDGSELVRISAGQRRILLTRDRALLENSGVSHGYWLRETDARRQLAEVIRRFDLAGRVCRHGAHYRCLDRLVGSLIDGYALLDKRDGGAYAMWRGFTCLRARSKSRSWDWASGRSSSRSINAIPTQRCTRSASAPG